MLDATESYSLGDPGYWAPVRQQPWDGLNWTVSY